MTSRVAVAPDRRLWQVAVYAAAMMSLLAALFCTTPVRAQDDGADEVGGAAAPAEAPPPAAAPADPPAAAPAPGENAPAPTPASEQSALAWLIAALGWPYVITFLAISFVFVSLLVMSILSARRENFAPQELMEGFEQKLVEKDYQGAYDMASADESILGRILSAGLAKLNRGYAKALEGMQEVGEDESMKVEHRLSYIALIGTISPMVGLLGTVDGMVRSFRVIVRSGATPKASELAEGISTALLTTLVGLLIAIPALAAYHILRNRVTRLFLEVGIASENLMNRFEDVQPKGMAKKG